MWYYNKVMWLREELSAVPSFWTLYEERQHTCERIRSSQKLLVIRSDSPSSRAIPIARRAPWIPFASHDPSPSRCVPATVPAIGGA
jgi:hypothetical protein